MCKFVADRRNTADGNVDCYHKEPANWDELTVVLNKNEAEIFKAYKLDGKNVREVAGTFNTTETNIYTICSRAIRKLRKHFAEK